MAKEFLTYPVPAYAIWKEGKIGNLQGGNSLENQEAKLNPQWVLQQCHEVMGQAAETSSHGLAKATLH